ncbi:Insulin-like growth factor binding protein, N-terminal [Pseudocohnilembus persalinus]|uniref:Insulin-like growth factor binding protein, N-terminal n=1 Tax=Pseudocohnilembus persalinus TaxID=266149 RepID=A0A0V0QW28_PSEPJ|nr:Insulin-like growth factor binding protein, N-terminal [Pseudocohnilembus persalinus]|eukprot:KRX06572.1 Insulin-like growth factor binding protein, N-terminal [Pseudocohnilembus persalinus]
MQMNNKYFIFLIILLNLLVLSQSAITQSSIDNKWTQTEIIDNQSSFLLDNQNLKLNSSPKKHDMVTMKNGISAVIFGDEAYNKVFIQFWDIFGNIVSFKKFDVQGQDRHNYQISKTNQENEIFYAVVNNSLVYYGFLNQNSEVTRNCDFEQINQESSYNVQVKKGNKFINILIQANNDELFLYTVQIDIEGQQILSFRKNLKGTGLGFKYFKYSLFVSDNDSGKIVGNLWAQEFRVQIHDIDFSGNVAVEYQTNENSFLDYIINSEIQFNPKSHSYDQSFSTSVLSDTSTNLLKINTFQKNQSEFLTLCSQSYENQFFNGINLENIQYDVMNQEYLWIKAQNSSNNQTVVFFANPMNCQVYLQDNGEIIMYNSQFQNGMVFHTISKNGNFFLNTYGQIIGSLQTYSIQQINMVYPCLMSCQSCSQSFDICDVCVISLPERIGEKCECQDGFYDDGRNEQCQICDWGCETCSEQGSCNSCLISQPQRNLELNCACPKGYYDDFVSGQCQICDRGCATCSEQGSCDTCLISLPQRIIEQNCTCPDGYYDNQESEQCQTCQWGCATCSKQGNCDSCKFSQPERILNQICQCPDECHHKCKTCSDYNQCTECSNLRQGLQCEFCIEGYYIDKNEKCQKCSYQCETCQDQNSCLQCKIKEFLLPYCKQPAIGHFYLNKGNQLESQYLSCSIQCENCEGHYDNCTSCQGKNREIFDQNSEKKCQCKAGYHDNFGKQQDCEKCPKFCKKCLSHQFCTECDEKKENLIHDFLNGKCICKRGYRLSQLTQNCEKCYYYKGECLMKCPGNTIIDENQGVCLNQKISQKSRIIYYGYGFVVIYAIVCYIIYIVVKKKFERIFGILGMDFEEVIKKYKLQNMQGFIRRRKRVRQSAHQQIQVQNYRENNNQI